MATLGVDFGTSNTAAAVAAGGRPFVIPLEDGREVLPTAIFLDYARREMVFGHAAVAALVQGREGRFMRALKRVLGTPLMHEPRQLLNRRMTLTEVIAAFLARVKANAETSTGMRFDAVVAGRPVRFHAADPDRDRAAEADLAGCYRAAGFSEVTFLMEPEAAALAAGNADLGDGYGLVVDIGGGTSDFTLYRSDGRTVVVVASHGVRVGGTDADRALSLTHAMPRLGLGGPLRAVFGPALHDVPVGLYHDLATWEKIAFVYSADSRRAAADYLRAAVDPVPMRRLVSVLEHELGHDLAFAVERAKIAANAGPGRIDMGTVERGLQVPLDGADLARDLAGLVQAIAGGALAAVAAGGVAPQAVAQVVMVGGSGLLVPVRSAIAGLFPGARMVQAGAFSAVAEGLGLRASGQA